MAASEHSTRARISPQGRKKRVNTSWVGLKRKGRVAIINLQRLRVPHKKYVGQNSGLVKKLRTGSAPPQVA